MKTAAARIKRRSLPSGACLLWQGSRDRWGYGRISVRREGRKQAAARAHRIAYELVNGPIPDGLVIDHMCHQPACVNPDHLRAVPPRSNSQNRRGANANNKSGRLGVHFNRAQEAWRASISIDGKKVQLGYFDTAEAAEKAYLVARAKHFDLPTTQVA